MSPIFTVFLIFVLNAILVVLCDLNERLDLFSESSEVPSYIEKVEEKFGDVIVYGSKEEGSYFPKLGIGDDLEEALRDYREHYGGSVFERKRTCINCGTTHISESSFDSKCGGCGEKGNYLITDKV